MNDFEHPLSLLDDIHAFQAWKEEVGSEEATRQLEEAARKHMAKHGNRSALDIGEKLEHLNAQYEEFVV